MKSLLMVYAFCLLAIPAAAIVDPAPDQMSIFFDATGEVYETSADAMESVDAFVVLLRPTFDAISGYEFGYEIEGNLDVNQVGLVGENRIDLVYKEGLHVVRLPEPMPVGEATVLCFLTVVPLDEQPVNFKLLGATPKEEGVAPRPAVWREGRPHSIGLIGWDPIAEMPVVCATINGTVQAGDESTWGGVKSLYR